MFMSKQTRAIVCGLLTLFGTAICVFVFVSFGEAQSSDEPLGNVVRQKPTHKAARLVTNDEIPSVEVPSTPVSTAASSSDPGLEPVSSANSNLKTENDKSASKSGITIPGLLNHSTVQQAQTVLESLKHDHQALIDNYEKIEKKLAETNDESLRRVYSDSLARRNETMSRNEKAIADVENAIRMAQGGDGQGGGNETQ
jgi:hypothetical protein